MTKKASENGTNTVPDSVIESMARCIFPAIQEFFESEEGKREFEEWQKKQAQSRKKCA